MKDCEKLEAFNLETRKARLEKHNRMVQRKLKTPESSVLGSSNFSYDLSLNSLSLNAESEGVTERTHHIFSSRSKRPSEVLTECTNPFFSEKDQKILRLMAERREAKIKQEEKALSAKQIWEEEKLQQAKRAKDKEKRLMEYLAKRKREEEWENFIRKNERLENLKQEKKMLEMRINERHEKVEKRHKDMQLRKKVRPEVLNTSSQVMFHRQLKEEKEKQAEIEKAVHLQLFEAKEKRSQEKLREILAEKCRKMKHESMKRQFKWQAAKNFRDEMNKMYEEEQIKNLRYLERNQAIREERVLWSHQWRKKLTSEKNERERYQHDLILNRLKEEEIEKVNQAKKIIHAKDCRIKILQEKKEAAISRSRHNSRTSAYLRQKMRSSYDL